jgi:diamine N-acetyltransferase
VAVELREITKETVRAICNLDVAGDQRGFVAPNALSIAQAHFEPKHWMRAIYADDEPVGFILTDEDPTKGRIISGGSWSPRSTSARALAVARWGC